MFFFHKERLSWGIFLGEAHHMPQTRILWEEEWKKDFPNPKVNSKACGETKYVELPMQHQEFVLELQTKWTLGRKLLDTSSKAWP